MSADWIIFSHKTAENVSFFFFFKKQIMLILIFIQLCWSIPMFPKGFRNAGASTSHAAVRGEINVAADSFRMSSGRSSLDLPNVPSGPAKALPAKSAGKSPEIKMSELLGPKFKHHLKAAVKKSKEVEEAVDKKILAGGGDVMPLEQASARANVFKAQEELNKYKNQITIQLALKQDEIRRLTSGPAYKLRNWFGKLTSKPPPTLESPLLQRIEQKINNLQRELKVREHDFENAKNQFEMVGGRIVD